MFEANKILNHREAAGILRLEAAGSPYGHLAATVQHNIADLSQYIESVKNMWKQCYLMKIYWWTSQKTVEIDFNEFDGMPWPDALLCHAGV